MATSRASLGGATADKRGETCEWRGTGVMLQGQGEGSVESNAKRRRRVMVEVKREGGVGWGGGGGEEGVKGLGDRAALRESNEEREHLVYLS